MFNHSILRNVMLNRLGTFLNNWSAKIILQRMIPGSHIPSRLIPHLFPPIKFCDDFCVAVNKRPIRLSPFFPNFIKLLFFCIRSAKSLQSENCNYWIRFVSTLTGTKKTFFTIKVKADRTKNIFYL